MGGSAAGRIGVRVGIVLAGAWREAGEVLLDEDRERPAVTDGLRRLEPDALAQRPFACQLRRNGHEEFVQSRDLSYDHPLTFRFFGPEAGGEYPSTRAFVEALFGANGAFANLPKFRNVLTLEPHDLPTRADAPLQELFREKDVQVTSIAVDHDDVPAVAYRIEHGGHAVVTSGDLASKNDNLIRIARDADLLVNDAAVRDPPASGSEGPRSTRCTHTPPKRIGEVAAAAHVRAVRLSHLTPGVEAASDEVLRSVRAGYGGPVHFATDCMRVGLTTKR